jgi:hypothetical protein
VSSHALNGTSDFIAGFILPFLHTLSALAFAAIICMLAVLTYSTTSDSLNMEPRKKTFGKMSGAEPDDQPANKRQRSDTARTPRGISSRITAPSSLKGVCRPTRPSGLVGSSQENNSFDSSDLSDSPNTFRATSNIGVSKLTEPKPNPDTTAGNGGSRATRSASKAAASKAANTPSLGTQPATRSGGGASLFGGNPQASHQHAASAKKTAPKTGASKQEGEKAIPQNKAATGNLNEKVVVGNMAEGNASETNSGSALSPVEAEVLDPRGDLTLLVGQEGKVGFLVCSRALARSSPYWENMLYGPFEEGKDQQRDGTRWTVDLPEDNPDALRVCLRAVHCKFDIIPRTSRATKGHPSRQRSHRAQHMQQSKPRSERPSPAL